MLKRTWNTLEVEPGGPYYVDSWCSMSYLRPVMYLMNGTVEHMGHKPGYITEHNNGKARIVQYISVSFFSDLYRPVLDVTKYVIRAYRGSSRV